MRQTLLRWLLKQLTEGTTVSSNLEIEIIGKKMIIRSERRAYWYKTKIKSGGLDVQYATFKCRK